MSQHLATIVYVAGILAAFYFDRDKEARTSKALWIPIIWLMINGSRPISLWFQSGPTIGDEYADGSPLDAAVFGMLLAAGLVVLGRRWKQVDSLLRNNFAILLFLAYCLASTLWSDSSFVSFKRWIKSLGDVVMIVIVLTDPNQHAAIRRFLSRVGYILIPVSILFIKYFPAWGRGYDQWSGIAHNTGITSDKNALGYDCLILGFFFFWYLLRTLQQEGGKTHFRSHDFQLTSAHGPGFQGESQLDFCLIEKEPAGV